MEENILICGDCPEDIFTAVYIAYEKHYSPETTAIQITEGETLRLFASYERIEADMEKCEKVMRTLKRRFGEEGFLNFCLAIAAPDTEKATAVYRTIARGLGLRRPETIFYQHADPNVRKTMQLRSFAWREMDKLRGFVRFRELKSGILLSEIQPKSNVLPWLAEHFADRFPAENFLICDKGRSLFAVHEAGRQWFLAGNMQLQAEKLKESEQEQTYQELFRCFCHKISIESRSNEALQKNMLPIRFRPYMTEFTMKVPDGGYVDCMFTCKDT